MKGAFKAIFKIGPLTLLTLSLSALMIKIIAIVFGPAGVGVFSLLRQTQQTFVSVATLNGDTALVQGLCSLPGREREDYLVTVGKLFLINALVVSCIFYFLSPFLGRWILPSQEVNSIGLVRWMLVPSFVSCVNVFILGVMNGYRAIGKMASSQAISAFIGAIVAYPLLQNSAYSFFIVLLALISITNFGISYTISMRNGWLKPLVSNFFQPLQKKHAIHFFSISWIAVIVGFSGAGTLLLVRLAISHYFGIKSAGIFDAAWTLSSVYLIVFLSSFSTYFLPELSSELNPKLFNDKIVELMHLSIVVSVAIILLLISLKPLAVTILYSSEFLSSLKIFRWMLVGDYFKVIAWVFSLPLLARRQMNAYLYFSLLWNVIFIGLAMASIIYLDTIEYIGFGYLVAQVIYAIYSCLYWRKYYNLRFSKKLWGLWLCGALSIIGSSLLNWNSESASFVPVLTWCFFIFIFVWLGLGADARGSLKKSFMKRTILGG